MASETSMARLSLNQAVQLSEEVSQRCRHAAENPDLEDFPSLALYRNLIQMADGIQILLPAGASRPTLPLLRNMLESFFSIKYIHQEDYGRRSLCWLCAYIHQEIDLKEMIDPSTTAGMAFQDIVVKEFPEGPPDTMPGDARVARDAEALRQCLANPKLVPVEEEYRRLKDRYRRPPKWHRLFNGPSSIYRLADSVGMLSYYELFYGVWSATVHGTDATNLLFEQNDGSTEFRPLRFIEYPEQIEQGAELFLQLATQQMMKRFLSENQSQDP